MTIKLANETHTDSTVDFFKTHPEEANYLPGVMVDGDCLLVDGSHRFTALAEIGEEIVICLYKIGEDYDGFDGWTQVIDEEYLATLSGAEYDGESLNVIFRQMLKQTSRAGRPIPAERKEEMTYNNEIRELADSIYICTRTREDLDNIDQIFELLSEIDTGGDEAKHAHLKNCVRKLAELLEPPVLEKGKSMTDREE